MVIKMRKILSVCVSVIVFAAHIDGCAAKAVEQNSIFPQHEPYGKGIGTMPGRVVWSHNPDSVNWDGSGYWWETEHFDEDIILSMVNSSVAALANESDAKKGWNTLFESHNKMKNKSGGYKSGEKIAIKANINGSGVMNDDTSGQTHMSYTNPMLLKALLLSLVKEAKAAPEDITVYDVSRLFPDYMIEMCTGGVLKGINFVGRNNGIADEDVPINWSYQFSGEVNYLPTCVTEAEYLINLANLKGHSYGITLCAKNHFGSFINGNMMRPPEGANLHQWLTKSEMGIYSPLVDLTANKNLGGKTVLYMLDAIICAPSEGVSITENNSKWQQEPFNNYYTASVFVSQDPAAIDSVGADFLANEPIIINNNSSVKNNTIENYLHEAGLIANPPSGVVYTDGDGGKPINLGVHEHWNNAADKKYSRNFGGSEGIELVKVQNMEELIPVMVQDGNITVTNVPENCTVIIAFYNGGELYNVKLYKGRRTISADILNDLPNAGEIKVFLWDMKSVKLREVNINKNE